MFLLNSLLIFLLDNWSGFRKCEFDEAERDVTKGEGHGHQFVQGERHPDVLARLLTLNLVAVKLDVVDRHLNIR